VLNLATLPARVRARYLAAALGRVRAAGDVEGHPFHGNQWTGGGGSATEQRQALHQALVNYTADSTPINDVLRSGKQVPALYRDTVASLDRAIAESPLDTESNDELYVRIVPGAIADSWKDGDIVVDKGFVSVSEDMDFHAALMENLGEHAGLVASYKTTFVSIPKGTGLLRTNSVLNSEHPMAWQKESILGRGHSFKVSRDQGDVYLELVK
jgi:hypothetical protein